MKRRRFFQSAAALPALAPLPAAAQYSSPAASGNTEFPTFAETSPEAVADGVRRTFSAEQAEAFRHLAALLIPKVGERPGAVEAGAPEFLDFLLRASKADRQLLFRNGLDRLNAEAQRLHHKTFAQLSAEQAKPILAPLTKPWTHQPPTDPFHRFLREAKDDLLQATVNSREYAQAMSRRSRGAAGTNPYFLPLD